MELKRKWQKIDTDISLPTKTHSKNGNGGLKPWVNADIILDLPSIEAGETYNGNLPVYNHTANNLSRSQQKKKGYLLLEKAEEVEMLLPDELVLKCHKNSNGHSDVYGILELMSLQ